MVYEQAAQAEQHRRSEVPDDSGILDRLLRDRRSVRAFLPLPLEQDVLERVFEMAQLAPSNCNAQPWRVEVLSGEAIHRLRETLCAAVDDGIEECPDFPITTVRPGEYRVRQIAAAKTLFAATGVARDDLEARRQSFLRNFRFFDAPHVALLFVPEWCGEREAADVGMFAQSLMLALTANGAASCPQAAVSHYAALVRHELGIPDGMRLLFGLSFGYEDKGNPANAVRTDRMPVEQATKFRNK